MRRRPEPAGGEWYNPEHLHLGVSTLHTMNQAAVTVADILRQAERIGWAVSDTRAAEIAAVAAPAYAALERASAELDFDVDTLSLYAALEENRAPPPIDAPAAGPMAPPRLLPRPAWWQQRWRCAVARPRHLT